MTSAGQPRPLIDKSATMSGSDQESTIAAGRRGGRAVARKTMSNFNDSPSQRPNLFIVGAPKCGTTAWVEYLNRRADIYFPPAKEPHAFNTDLPGFRWYHSLEEYLALFQEATTERYIGEGSVNYLFSRDAAQNIARFAPNAKILIFVRQHSAFMKSYHNQMVYNLDENLRDLTEAWDASGYRIGQNIPPACREPQMLDYKRVGLFAEQIDRFLEAFDPHNVLIVRYEDWTGDPRATYLEILQFLDLPDDGEKDFPVVNAAHRHRFEWLALLTQRRSGPLSAVMRQIRRLPGLSNLKLSHHLRRFNTAFGHKSSSDADIMREIDRFFADDAARVRKLYMANRRLHGFRTG